MPEKIEYTIEYKASTSVWLPYCTASFGGNRLIATTQDYAEASNKLKSVRAQAKIYLADTEYRLVKTKTTTTFEALDE